ncbi:hypothetical protein GPECTOR_21g663 [Gonium pectorale]|uniref:AB hydrolase-1 domain-containing protein n=1 Tax=Gonium pectorale TaxID=33097 RepID=A0A150GHZ4_GONPE|nr:hypothetical protein GPECTOR_21g663 [Gonium pectorale]|eukprot:KXZ49437.1 hypothetical protein GPECTOR_21g663 [Gonium pectorale]
MIMGFAAGGDAWLPMLKDLFLSREGTIQGDKDTSLEVLVFDNRGIGESDSPHEKRRYTTALMAQDTLAVMDHLGWRKAHVVGHSMGGMIASRLALAAPERVASLTLISVTGGGAQSIPLNCKALAAGLRGALCTSPESRAAVDLSFHYSRKLLDARDPASGRRLRELLREEYIAGGKAGPGQPPHGQAGQLNAVFTHSLSKAEQKTLEEAPFPIKYIHGQHDILAAPRHAARLASAMSAPMVVLDGAHFITRDCAAQINDELMASIEAARQGVRNPRTVHPTREPDTYRAGCLCCCA